jgi:hypothetical protein
MNKLIKQLDEGTRNAGFSKPVEYELRKLGGRINGFLSVLTHREREKALTLLQLFLSTTAEMFGHNPEIQRISKQELFQIINEWNKDDEEARPPEPERS